MNQKTKLILALSQVHNLTNLLENNPYQGYFYSHLISIEVELKRQLTNSTIASKLEE
jgi:hypothetical protein